MGPLLSVLSSGWFFLAALVVGLLVAPRHLGAEIGVVVVFALLVPASCGAEGRLTRTLSHRWLAALGERSYALYATHWLVVELAWNLFQRMPAPVSAGTRAMFFAATLGGALALAAAIHRSVEVPARQAIQGWMARRMPRSGGG